MATITIELPEVVTIGGPNGLKLESPTENWTGEWILENALHGLKQRRSDKLSVTKDRAKLDELDEKIKLGEDLATGERGSRMDYVEKAEVAVLTNLFIGQGEGKSKAEKSAKGKDAWDRITRVAIYAQATADGLDESAVRKLNILELIAQFKDTVKAQYKDEIATKAAELEELDAKARARAQVKIPAGIKLG